MQDRSVGTEARSPLDGARHRRARIGFATVLVLLLSMLGAVLPAGAASAAENITITNHGDFGLATYVQVTTGSDLGSRNLRLTGTGPNGQVIEFDIPHSGTSSDHLLSYPTGGNWSLVVGAADGVSAPLVVAVTDWEPTIRQNADRSITATFPPPKVRYGGQIWFVTILDLAPIDSQAVYPRCAERMPGTRGTNGDGGCYVPGQSGTADTTLNVPASELRQGVEYRPTLRYELAFESALDSRMNKRPMPYRIVPPVSVSYGAPTDLVAMPLDGLVDLTWNVPSDPPPSGLNYRVEYRQQGAATWIAQPTQTDRTRRITGLTNGVPYEFRVVTLENATVHLPTAPAVATPVTAPAAPTVTGAHSADGALRVDALFPTTAAAPSDPARAVWEVQATGSTVWDVRVPTSSAPWVLPDLLNGVAYRVRVRAVNGSGAAQSAEAGPFTPQALPAVPVLETPTQGLRSIAVRATFPASTAAPVTSTEWQIGAVSGGTVPAAAWTAATPAETEPGRFTFSSGLATGTEYRVRARSANATGVGGWTESATVRALDAADVPTITEVTVGDGILVVRADLHATDGRPSDPTRTVWQKSTNGGTTWTAATATFDTGRWTIMGLPNGVAHILRAQGAGTVGSSAFSSASAPRVPVALAAQPSFGAVTARDAGASADLVQPSSPTAPAVTTELRVLRWTSPTSSSVVPGVTPVLSGGVVTVAGLDNGGEYTLEARSVNGTGPGAWGASARFTPRAVPGAPVLGAPVAHDGAVTIHVDLDASPATRADPGLTTWEVSVDGGAWRPATAVETQPSVYQITGLDNGASYRVRVTTANATGVGPASISSAVVPIAAPSTPVVRSVTADDGSAFVDVQVPTNAAAPATTWVWEVAEVTFAANSGSDPVSDGPPSAGLVRDRSADVVHPHGWMQTTGPWTPRTAQSSADGYRIPGLTNGTTYVVRLTTSNTSGSNSSASSSNVTPFGVPAAPVIRVAAPQDGAIVTALSSTATIGAPVRAVEWEVATVTGSRAGQWRSVPVTVLDELRIIGSGTTETVADAFRLTGLTNGTDYQVRTRATNARGASPWTAWRSTVAPAASPTPGPNPGPTTSPNPDPTTTPVPDPGPAPTPTNPPMPDTDNDGVPNRDDPDADGDGIPNAVDPDVDGDGIANVWDADVDGDDDPNGSDPDRDADRILNADDATPNGIGTPADIDGDGLLNEVDSDIDGDGTANVFDPDIDGDGIPNGSDQTPNGPDSRSGDPVTGSIPDIDGDGIPNAVDPDVDGDGIANVWDTDVDSDGTPNASDADIDGDGTANAQDMTPNGIGTPADIDGDGVPNAEDADMDGDGVVNVSDADIDGDGIRNEDDSTPAGPGSSSSTPVAGSATDVDGDGIPNAVDPDVDGDGVANVWDRDVDGDGLPNATDDDADADGIANAGDATPNGIGTPGDIDGDGVANEVDADMDGDGTANVYDPDIDGDGIPNGADPTPAGPGSLPGGTGIGTAGDIDGDGIPNATDPDVDGDGIANVWDADVDGDGRPNASDDDADADGILNGPDATPNGIGTPADIDGDGVRNEDDHDIDGDGLVNASDPDIDGDGIPNGSDPTPAGPGSRPGGTGPGRFGDLDGDGIPDSIDDDIDGDGVPNGIDPDVDGDGVPNGLDPDVDGDGIPNGRDADVDGDGLPNGLDPDVDGDGLPNGQDPDVDGDGIENGHDPDTDGDGRSNATDPDVDGDGIANVFDPDVDGDGVPNASDPDADADGVPNGSDPTPNGIGTEADIDGDGTPNETDADIDGDGRNNASDGDIDGDGIPNAQDTTPVGPVQGTTGGGGSNGGGSSPGGSGTGTPADVDGDGIPNGLDPDVDGDGIPNGLDLDVDGDGIPNGLDLDVDGDGIPNASDPDVDGDGVPNGRDADVDGDGVVNFSDPDIDGDGVPNGRDDDRDGDGIPNAADETPNGIGTRDDLDGDGFPNDRDGDIDGDGTPNSEDGDIDGDGVPNEADPDMDGDGLPNDGDPSPQGPARDIVLPTTTSVTTTSVTTTSILPTASGTRVPGTVRAAVGGIAPELPTAPLVVVTSDTGSDAPVGDGPSASGDEASSSPFGTPSQLVAVGFSALLLILLAAAALWLVSRRREGVRS